MTAPDAESRAAFERALDELQLHERQALDASYEYGTHSAKHEAALFDVKRARAEVLRLYDARPAAPGETDENTDAWLWSFARTCILAGLTFERGVAGYESMSARIDALAVRLVNESHAEASASVAAAPTPGEEP